MIMINKIDIHVFFFNLYGARLLGHPVYIAIKGGEKNRERCSGKMFYEKKFSNLIAFGGSPARLKSHLWCLILV